jgi:hypothetical protein
MGNSTVNGVHASEIISTFDIDKPERLNTLFRSKGEQGLPFFALIKSLGFMMPVAQETYSHDEEDWLHENITAAGAVGDPGAGADLVITLSAGDLDSGNRFYPRLFDVVLMKNDTTGIITDISGIGTATVVVTISPNLAAETLGAVSAGDEIAIITNAHSEGSDQPGGRVSGTIKYENDMQIIKETLSVTGTEMTNQKWIDKVSNGKKFVGYYIKGQWDAEYRMALQMDGAFLFGKRTDNAITDPSTGRLIKTTEGLFPYAKRTGNTLPYTTGAFTVQTFNQAAKILDREFAANHVMSLNGIDLQIEIEDVLKDYFDNTDVSYMESKVASDLYQGDKGLAASVDFQNFKKGGRCFHFKKLGQMSHQKVYGSLGYDQPGMGLMIPVGKKKDFKSGKELPTFGMRYKQMGDHNRMMQVWNNSGAGAKPGTFVNSTDVHNHFLRAHVGFHAMAGNQMIVLDPNS